ncbi:MAG: AMP-binding protein, partial [Proteobacteria bacterium]|nr:AMP-binding protein [Pseudomonadota bacterium]
STEASVSITAQPDGEVLPDTVGRPSPGVEIKINEAGEVMFRSPGVFIEYYRDPEETASIKTEDGWVHTGDAGFISDNGHLKIIDRAKDVGKLNDGTLFAPKYIENKLKFFPEIKEAVAFGHDRDFCAVFVNIDLEAVGNWAERHNIAYASYQELAAQPDIQSILKSHIESVNRDLASDPNLAGSQIQRFLVLHKELDPDDGELTRTRKVRRGFVSEKYRTLIEALYSGAERAHVETEMTFKDGRKGSVAADIEIVAAETYPGAEPLRQAS